MQNEELASKKRAVELFDSGKINEFETGTTEGLKQVHQFLFRDVFDFAGKIRDVDLVKGELSFRSCYLPKRHSKKQLTLSRKPLLKKTPSGRHSG